MREKVFVDVGGHGGSTAAGVFASRFNFDRVISVEPDPRMVARLEQRFADQLAAGRYLVAPFGLADENGTLTLYGDNADGGASMIAGKSASGAGAAREVEVVEWNVFLERYGLQDADLYVKINCEGAEIWIADSIVKHDDGQIKSLVIDYDIVKSPFGGWKKWRSMAALRRAGVPFLLTEQVFVKGSKRGPIENWLGALPSIADPVVPREPINLHQFARVKYIEAISALGVKHDLLKRRRPAAPQAAASAE